MFRFLHAADPHLDSPLRGLEAHEGAPVDVLRGATRRAFENLVELAITERVDFVLIAGDLYDGDWKDYNTGLFFRGQMARLDEAAIPVYLIAGNHDAASVISKKLSLPGNVHDFSTRAAESIEVPGLPVVIHGRGFATRSVSENLASEYPAPTTGKFNIGLLHTSLTGRPGHDTYAPCTELELRQKGYDYWALGHVHQPEIIHEDPWIVFAGNCQGRHARETGPRGCRLVIVDDSSEVAAVDWRTLDVVRWCSAEVDVDGATSESDILDRVRDSLANAIEGAEGRLLAARVRLVGSTELHGTLHRRSDHLRAEILAVAQDFGEDAIWIERVKIGTSPIYDLAQLAERDALTHTVLETLEDDLRGPIQLPADAESMLKALPEAMRQEVRAELSEEGESLLEDVRAIILESLARSGGGEIS